MALEDFIRREYGSMVSSKSAAEAYTQREKVLSNLKKNKNRDSLQQQRADMQARREMYDIAKNAGVISSTKDGKELITGTLNEKMGKVQARMELLSSKQLDAMSGLAKSQGGKA